MPMPLGREREASQVANAATVPDPSVVPPESSGQARLRPLEALSTEKIVVPPPTTTCSWCHGLGWGECITWTLYSWKYSNSFI